ncbi:PREDICTED: aspartic proteinase-like protein 2 [Lupinus angustifolius]|uniref:aspartic proteinase-like protein 2 n=1 Tax=Lupinus angustifolius TaxID=3871 RepID=UPI00092F5A91|nr:PREDICTED: aspartic proteinase-like protein 2 [Lupinus angustifolius]
MEWSSGRWTCKGMEECYSLVLSTSLLMTPSKLDIVLKDKIVVYDLANQRIGWTNCNCSLPINISSSSGKDINEKGEAFLQDRPQKSAMTMVLTFLKHMTLILI